MNKPPGFSPEAFSDLMVRKYYELHPQEDHMTRLTAEEARSAVEHADATGTTPTEVPVLAAQFGPEDEPSDQPTEGWSKGNTLDAMFPASIQEHAIGNLPRPTDGPDYGPFTRFPDTVLAETYRTARFELMDDKMLALTLCIKPSTLKSWRSKGFGPPYIKIGPNVFYHEGDVKQWLATQAQSPTPVRRK